MQYKLSEDPKLLVTGSVSASSRETLVSLAPDARVVGVSVDLSIYIYATSSGELLASLDSVHKGERFIVTFSPCSTFTCSVLQVPSVLLYGSHHPSTWFLPEERTNTFESGTMLQA